MLCKRAVCRHLQTVLTEVVVGKLTKKGILTMCFNVTARGRCGRSHKVQKTYTWCTSLAKSIKFSLSVLCVKRFIHTKFGMKVPVQHTQKIFVAVALCHNHQGLK